MREPVTMILPASGAPVVAGAFWPWVLKQFARCVGSLIVEQSTATLRCCACCNWLFVCADADEAQTEPIAITDAEIENRKKLLLADIFGIPLFPRDA
jgi:hypothetical protein